MHESSGSDGVKVRKVGFLAVKHLEWRPHLDRLVRSSVLGERSRHEHFQEYFGEIKNELFFKERAFL